MAIISVRLFIKTPGGAQEKRLRNKQDRAAEPSSIPLAGQICN